MNIHQRNGRGNHRPAVTVSTRTIPQNLDAERQVLGAILLDNAVLDEVAPILRPEHLWRDAHQIVYEAILERYRAGQRTDTVLLADDLERAGQFHRIGGDALLTELMEQTPHAANAVYHAQIVRERAIARQLLDVTCEVQRAIHANQSTAEDLIELAEREVFRVADQGTISEARPVGVAVKAAMDRVLTRRTRLGGLGTWDSLDKLTDGFQPGQFVIVAARPSMGKTQLACNIAEAVALEQRHGVLLISLEMGAQELGERLIVLRAKVDAAKLRHTAALRDEEWGRLHDAQDDWQQAPLYLDDSPTQTALQILAAARRWKARQNIKLVIIDYLQLITAPRIGDRDSREERVAELSRSMKAMARELQVPVIALCQLNRKAENRSDHRPVMADLRESGALEQDADLVLLLHRPDYYDPNDQPGIAELIVSKNRNGPTGTVKLVFERTLGRFREIDVVPPIDPAVF